jgi:hypothetical protein
MMRTRLIWALGAAVACAGAQAADLRGLPPTPPFVMPAPVFVAPVVVPAPVAVFVPIPLLPFFDPPPPPPSYTLFSEPVGYPPEAHYHGRTRSAGEAEAEHYGYGGYVPQPRPLGLYGPDNRD